jgi:hypothetical protein
MEKVSDSALNRRQRPNTVHMVRQHHPGIDEEWPFPFRQPHRFAEHIDMPDQRIRTPFQQFTVKKYVPPGTLNRR